MWGHPHKNVDTQQSEIFLEFPHKNLLILLRIFSRFVYKCQAVSCITIFYWIFFLINTLLTLKIIQTEYITVLNKKKKKKKIKIKKIYILLD